MIFSSAQGGASVCEVNMIEQNNSSESKPRWIRYAVVLFIVPVLIPLVCVLLQKGGWTEINLTVIVAIFAGYWLGVLLVAAKLFKSQSTLRPVRLASPLIELHLSSELRDRLTNFAARRQQKLSVAAFELLDKEIPRFEHEEERDRALRDNEHLRQQAGQGAFLVAVTTEILRRLLLLSGALEADRKVWGDQINHTAVRIVSDALDHRLTTSEQLS
jgi:hypothetical protein